MLLELEARTRELALGTRQSPGQLLVVSRNVLRTRRRLGRLLASFLAVCPLRAFVPLGAHESFAQTRSLGAHLLRLFLSLRELIAQGVGDRALRSDLRRERLRLYAHGVGLGVRAFDDVKSLGLRALHEGLGLRLRALYPHDRAAFELR